MPKTGFSTCRISKHNEICESLVKKWGYRYSVGDPACYEEKSVKSFHCQDLSIWIYK